MKLNWKFDAGAKSLSADGPGETRYNISDTDTLQWHCERRDSRDRLAYVSWWQGKVPSLEEAMALCQRDAEEQEKRRVDAVIAEGEKARLDALRSSPRIVHDPMYVGPDGVGHSEPPKRPCDMNVQEFRSAAEEQVKKIVDAGKPSKFPGTTDASVWASRCTAWFGAFKVPDLTEWFDAALRFGFYHGLNDQMRPQATAERSENEADGSKSAKPKMDTSELSKKFDTLNEYVGKTAVELTARLRNVETLACNAASRVGQLWQKQTHEMREANKRIGVLEYKLPRVGEASLGTMHEEICKRLSDLEERAKWSADSRLVEERLSALEEGVKWCAKSDCVTNRLKEMESRLTQALSAKMQHHEEKVFPRIRALEQKPLRDSEQAAFVNRELGGLRASVQELEKRLNRVEETILPEHWGYIAGAREELHALEHRVTDLEPYGDEPPRFYADQIEKLGDRLAKLEELYSRPPRC